MSNRNMPQKAGLQKVLEELFKKDIEQNALKLAELDRDKARTKEELDKVLRDIEELKRLAGGRQ